MSSNSLRVASTISAKLFVERYISYEGTQGSKDWSLVMINQFNKKTKAVLYWTGKIWAASDEYAGTFNFENLGNFIFPDTVLFLFDNDELVVIDIADEIKRDYMAFDRYDNSVAFIHSVGGTTNLRDKISTFLDKNPSDIFKYKDVHGDTGDFVLTNEFDKEEVLESDLVQSLMRTFTDKTPFIIKRNDVISPRIIYANPTCFVYYYISMLKGIASRFYLRVKLDPLKPAFYYISTGLRGSRYKKIVPLEMFDY